MSKVDWQSLEEHCNSVKWIWAKTYATYAPHWYIRYKEQPYLYEILKRMIELHGVEEEYTNHNGRTYPCVYLYLGKYKYWYMKPVINKAEIKSDGKI